MHWWVEPSAAPPAFLSLFVVLGALRKCVGGWGGRGLLRAAVAMLLFRRLGFVCRDLEGLLARYRAGRLLRVVGRVGGGRVARACGAVVVPVVERVWPARFGWLVRAAAWEAAGYGSQLRTVLAQPEMVELLRACPQAGRVLRPICRALAIETQVLRPRAVGEPEIVVEPPVRVAKVRERKPRVPVDFGRIPLPRGVMAWVRRERSRKDFLD